MTDDIIKQRMRGWDEEKLEREIWLQLEAETFNGTPNQEYLDMLHAEKERRKTP